MCLYKLKALATWHWLLRSGCELPAQIEIAEKLMDEFMHKNGMIGTNANSKGAYSRTTTIFSMIDFSANIISIAWNETDLMLLQPHFRSRVN
ncbi:hypothetical protein ACJX0J_026332, partial [Zea mays]